MTIFPRIVAQLSRAALGVGSVFASPRLSILIYHRVHGQADPLFADEPDAAQFAGHMRYVARTFNVLTLGEAASRLAENRLPARALVITFDDGYADNVEIAMPILTRYGLRATFFVASGFLDGGRMWNDTVIESVRRCRVGALDLSEFGLGRCSLGSPADRRRVIDALLPRIKYLPPVERDATVIRVQRLCGVEALPHELMMRAEQVRELHAAGMEIGGHTVSHPILRSLSLADAEAEIAGGREQLESIIDAPVDVFAYPNGKPGVDYDREHVDLLGKCGFRAAVTTVSGVVQSGDGLFELPRFSPWRRSLPAWALQLLLNIRNTHYAVAPYPPSR